MPSLTRRTPEQKEQQRRETEARKQAEQIQNEWKAFYKTPAGQAHAGFLAGRVAGFG
jgi:hypothetical protein